MVPSTTTTGTEGQALHAHKLKVTIPEDHRVEVLAALAELHSVPLSAEESAILDGFEAFRREHPVQFASLTEEE